MCLLASLSQHSVSWDALKKTKSLREARGRLVPSFGLHCHFFGQGAQRDISVFVYKVSFGHFEGRTFIGSESPKLRSRDLKLKPAAGVFI